MKLSLLLLALPFLQAAEDHHHSCACEADELGFTIDCANEMAMTDALAALQANGCAAACESEVCQKNWFIVQSHHDYCPSAGLPTSITDGFHDFDTVCEECEITRILDDSVAACPVVDCAGGNMAYANLVTNNCLTTCNAACQTDFQTLVYVHDNCDHSVLEQDAEEGFHDMEAACEAFRCNSGNAEDPLECHDHEHSSGVARTSLLGAAVAGGVSLWM